MNAAYCQSLGDDSQLPWDDTPETHKQSLIAGVEMHLANPNATPEQSHQSWYAQKEAEGWVYGEFKDLEKKEHPCFLPYEDLPNEQKAKDYLFRATVHSMKDLPDVEEYLALVDEVKNLRLKIQGTALIATTPSVIPVAKLGASGIAIQYVGRKEQLIDRLYGSNLVFTKGQVRHVPSNIAGSLLKHPEFQRYEEQEEDFSELQGESQDDTAVILDAAKKQQDKEDEQETIVLDEIDTIGRIKDKKSLIEYAKNKYDQDLSDRSTVKTLQDQVTDLIKRFGVV